jgi:hypothetical protein
MANCHQSRSDYPIVALLTLRAVRQRHCQQHAGEKSCTAIFASRERLRTADITLQEGNSAFGH